MRSTVTAGLTSAESGDTHPREHARTSFLPRSAWHARVCGRGLLVGRSTPVPGENRGTFLPADGKKSADLSFRFWNRLWLYPEVAVPRASCSPVF